MTKRRAENPDIHYRMEPNGVRLSARACDTRDIRLVIMSLWAMLDDENREDQINELTHYRASLPNTYMQPLADALCKKQHGADSPLCGNEAHPESGRITVVDKLDGVNLTLEH